MTRLFVLVALVALVACRGDSTKTRRTGSAAPVEMITQPEQPDGSGAGGAGTTTDEIEPNDGEDVATPFSLGGTARGRIDPETEADYYRLDIDKPGVLQLMLSGVEGVDLSLELLDAAGTTLAESERSGARIKEGIPNLSVAPGRYTVIVRAVIKKKPKPKKGKKAKPVEEAPAPAPVYELTAQLVAPSPGSEREPDDDRATANDLIVADNATGFVGWSKDKDFWKLSVETLSDNNALDVQVSAIEGLVLELEVTDAVGTVLASRKAPRGKPVLLQNLLPVVAPGAPPFYYLVVRGDRSNPETPYTLHATAKVLGPDPEIEPNDSVDRPQVIAADRTVVHATWTAGDIDCFGIAPAASERTIEFTIDTPPDIDLAAELLVDGKVVATANKGKKGVIEKVAALVPANGVAVVRVKNPDGNATGDAKYDVTVIESSATGDQ